MNTPNILHAPEMPLLTHWTSHDLADAVPLRLSELLGFDAYHDIGTGHASANTVAPRHARSAQGYLQNAALQIFRIR